MSRKSLPVMSLALILVLVLASAGVAYGMWAETLTINGTVATGNVDAELSIFQVWDVETKPIGTCAAVLSPDLNALTVTVGNGYPLYECYVKFDVHNVGSIPIHIHQPVLVNPSSTFMTVSYQDCYIQDYQLHTGDLTYCTLKIVILQAAGQSANYTFSGTILAHQYNEEP
ncbi:MAG: hypothetical protein HY864_16340 [Chloroflexi bacterium]|nr:hypothetical protein [Chloroflexota bacterium]